MLNSKETREIENIILKNYESEIELNGYFLYITFDDKIWIASKSTLQLDFDKIRSIVSIGLCIGKLRRNNLHLTVEGCQLIGKTAKKNVVMVDEENMKKYIMGHDVVGEMINCANDNFVIIKYKNDFIGSGILRNGKVENSLPKSRKLAIYVS